MRLDQAETHVHSVVRDSSSSTHCKCVLIQQRVKMKQGVAMQRGSTQSGCASARMRDHIKTDGGLQKSGISDKDNCTIRAFAIGFGMPYKDAHYMGELAGRSNGEGYWMYKIMNKAREYGYDSTEFKGGMTLGKFLKTFPKGRYICVRNGHAFAVIDGKIYDEIDNRNNCKLIRIFRIEGYKKAGDYVKENYLN